MKPVSPRAETNTIVNNACFATNLWQFVSIKCQNGSMDETDQLLLSLLRQDARTSVATLANKLKVSRGTVSNRIAKLQSSGVIVGYTVRLRPDAQPNDIRAWMSVAVQGNETRAVIASLLGEPGVAGLHDTNGRWDLLADLRAANLSELSQVLERIRLIRGISSTETSIHLETYRLS
jgi:DNA-binding Lrp family transcriptional regulator